MNDQRTTRNRGYPRMLNASELTVKNVLKKRAREAYYALGRKMKWNPAWPVVSASVTWTPKVNVYHPDNPPPDVDILVKLYDGKLYKGPLSPVVSTGKTPFGSSPPHN